MLNITNCSTNTENKEIVITQKVVHADTGNEQCKAFQTSKLH